MSETADSIRARRRRASALIAAIAAGVLLLTALRVAGDGLRAGVRDTVEGLSGGAPLAVWMGFGELVFPRVVERIAAGRKGVEAALPLLRGTVTLADDPAETLQLVGLDLAREAGLDRLHLARDAGDIRTWPADPQSVILATALARRWGVDVGDAIRLATPRGIEALTVRGLLGPAGIGRAFGGRVAVTDLPAAEAILVRRKVVHQLDLLLAPGADVAAVREDLRVRLPGTLSLGSPAERIALWEAVLGVFPVLLIGLGLLCLAAAVYPAYAALSTGATLIGMVTALLLGAIGTGIGIAGGIALAPWSAGLVSDAMGMVLQLRLPWARLALESRRLVEIGGLGIAATLLAWTFARGGVARSRPDTGAPAWRRFPARATASLAAVMLVVAAAVALSTTLRSHRESLAAHYETASPLAADLVVSAAATEAGWLETPLPARLATELDATPGVEAVETVLALPGQLYRGRRITVLGLSDGLLEPSRYGPRWYVEGDPARAAAALRAQKGVNVSVRLAERFGLRAGDSITLDSPAGPFRTRIAGIVRDHLSAGGTVVMRQRLAASLWDETGVRRFGVFVGHGASVERVRLAVTERLGDRYRLNVLTPREAADRQSRLLGRAFASVRVIALLVVVVVSFAAVFALPAAATDRRRALARSAAFTAPAAAAGAIAGLVAALVVARRLHLDYHPAFDAAVWYVTLAVGVALVAGRFATRRGNATGRVFRDQGITGRRPPPAHGRP